MLLWLTGDRRLVGRWKSDRDRTSAEIATHSDIDDARKNKLSALFGRLELRYTRYRCHATLDGKTSVDSYRVVAKDESSVVVVSSPQSGIGGGIYHIHFDGDFYWISLGNSSVREFFRRVP